MGLVSELQKTQAQQVALGVGLFLATVAPGMLTIFMFQRVLFQELDTVPLLVFAAALGFPVLVANYFCVVIGAVIAGGEASADESERSGVWLLGMLASFVVSYGALLASFEDRVDFRAFLWRLALFQGLILLFSIAYGVGERRDRKKKSDQIQGAGPTKPSAA